MRIVFVRHGHPDYKLDCLTELGHRHAEAAAERLAKEPFARILASTHGRAIETAEHIASRHNLPVETFDFMREIKWGPITGDELPYKNGYPWTVSTAMVAENADLLRPGWADEKYFSNNSVKFLVQNIGTEFDKLLETLGYTREGNYYRVTKKNDDTVAMVSHGGSSSVAISHMLNLPFPFFCETIRFGFTSTSVLTLRGEEGELISPRIEILNDCRHIKDITEVVYGV